MVYEKCNCAHNGVKTTEKNESTIKKNIDVTSKILRKRFHGSLFHFLHKTLTFSCSLNHQKLWQSKKRHNLPNIIKNKKPYKFRFIGF